MTVLQIALVFLLDVEVEMSSLLLCVTLVRAFTSASRELQKTLKVTRQPKSDGRQYAHVGHVTQLNHPQHLKLSQPVEQIIIIHMQLQVHT